ncbi:MAG: PAS domain S-box protein [Nitrospirae bacterium]|nr:PAS domain S-box protein [Nitrospirota bacterium]
MMKKTAAIKSKKAKGSASRVSKAAGEKIQELETRLAEAEETLEAIRSGAVDALVVSAPEGDQVYTLKGAEYPYRVFFETMNEGGAVISHEGLILACNKSFERMIGTKLKRLAGKSFYDCIPSEESPKISHFISSICETKTGDACQQALRVESVLLAPRGGRVPVQLALSAVHEVEKGHICVVITDLTDQKRAEEILRRSQDELEFKVRQRTAELEVTQEELLAQNEELRVTRDQLENSNDSLTDVNKELEAFTYSVSHDLRAPVRHVSGFAKIVLEDYADKLDTTGKNYLARILRGSEKMLRLIDDLLHFSQLSSLDIKRDMVDLSKLASDVIRQLSETEPDRKVEFELKGGLTVSADYQLMEIVISNLIGNAWKFTSKTENARIEFGVLNQNNRAVYYVRDNGAGFNPKYKEKLFQPFQRLHSENEFTGTGIGLAIVERIIRRHGGKVWAEGGTGKGATFFFTLN